MSKSPTRINEPAEEARKQAALAQVSAAIAEGRRREADPMPDHCAALGRLLKIAMSDTGQSRLTANFLLAWHNAGANGGWDPVDLWALDEAIGRDMLLLLEMVLTRRRYPPEWGFEKEIERVWELWRSAGKSNEDLPREHEH
jgi:hypothetical protein